MTFASDFCERIESGFVGSCPEAASTRTLYSDAPNRLDSDCLYAVFGSLECMAKDPLHVALRIEQATNDKQNDVSAMLRRCVIKFQFGVDDGLEYFRKGERDPIRLTLTDAMTNLSTRQAQARLLDIKTSDLPEGGLQRSGGLRAGCGCDRYHEPDIIEPTHWKTTVCGALVYAPDEWDKVDRSDC